MLHRHLQLVTDAVTARIKKDWDADIAAFDQGQKHIIMMADTLAEGIVKQFPKQILIFAVKNGPLTKGPSSHFIGNVR